mgnify:CR=1 FL=1
MSNETPLSPEAEKLAAARKRNLDLALSQIQKDFGENAIMRLGDCLLYTSPSPRDRG